MKTSSQFMWLIKVVEAYRQRNPIIVQRSSGIIESFNPTSIGGASGRCASDRADSVIKCLMNTKDRCLKIGGSTYPYLGVFFDSDWAGCRDTRLSTGSILVALGDCFIQIRVANSTCVVEYYVYTPAVKEFI